MDSQQEQEQPQPNLFKQKRDSYLIEIRKKKTNDQLQAKRVRLASQQDQNANSEAPQSIQELAASFIAQFKAGDLTRLHNVATAIRKAVSVDDNPPIEELVNSGAIEFIVELLKNDFNQSIELVIECLWIAANIASHKSKSVKYLVNLDIIPMAFHLLQHENQDVKENVIWILANIAGDSRVYRADLLKKGLVSKLDSILTAATPGQPIVSSCVWLMSNLCRGKPYPEFGEVASFLSYLEYFIKNSKDKELLEHCIDTLCSFTDTEDENQIKEVVDMDIYDELLGMIKEGNPKIKGSAVKTLGNILCNADDHTEEFVNRGCIEVLFPMLEDPVKLTRKNACWSYSNILASVPSQVSKVFEFENGKIIQKLLVMAATEEKEIASECLYALTNACDTGSVQEIDFLVGEGFIEMLLEMFKSGNDEALMEACLTALNTILSEGQALGETPDDNPFYLKFQQCDGINVLEKLQNYANNDMFHIIEEILDGVSGREPFYT